MRTKPNLELLFDQKVGGLDALSEDCQDTFRLGARLILVLLRNELSHTLELNRFEHTRSITEIRDHLDHLLEE